MADLGNRANVNSAIDLLLDDLQPDEAIQPSDHNVLLKDILDTLANGLSTVLRTGNTTDGENLTITSSSIFQFSNGSNGRLQSDTLTAFRNWTLPDTTGTIALLSDIPSSVNIYTANGTIGTGRVATLTDTLTFKDGTVNIQGAGTSTGSALAIYDNDTTPNKLWDFLDNGNVNLGGTSVINQDSNVLQFSNINSIGGLKFNGTSNNGIGLNLANGSNDFDFVVAGSFNTLIGTGSLGLLVGGAWAMQVKQNRQISIGSNFEPVSGYDLSVDKAYFDTEITVKAPAGIMQFNGYRTNVVNPSTPTFPNDKDFGLHKNTATGRCFLGYNDGGTIKFVQLTTSGVPNPSVQETNSTATFTINADEETTGVLTAIALATTIASPTGTPVQGQKLTFRFKDNGTAQSLTWNAIFRAIGLTLPTTTTANKTIYIGCIYNSTETKWDVIAIKEEV